ncbi:uncharacterized protein LOC133911927 isoform X2 [Phragmites australis]|uniref:uncharacterized protein LOC133911927 isoform X2 n=1 Tax=Phragmites australis TaxID=29695 RepID=UPI002D76B7EA|nr:uncharacterized protein LOC133911927 isoform X2 [Phragmites australis]
MAAPRAGAGAGVPVTGDRYLDLLVRFVACNAGALLDGSVTLRLHPVGLHYVASRLEALRELEAVGAGAPVDYLRAYVADLGDHRALEQLRRILRLLTSLKVVAAGPGRDPAPLSLLPFARLRVLELRDCDLSTSAARGLLDLRHTLERLVCYNSTDALRHVFTSRITDIKESPVWSKLSYVSCASNGLVLMDESLQLLPAVETLDLSRNKFAKLDNLRKCTKLRNLDLGFNHLRSISSLGEVSSRIVKLVVRNNALTTIHGIENLKSLMGLDLSYNIISNFSELEILGTLSLLQNLWLEGNPICCARWYRAHVFSFFRNPENLKLDDKGMNTQEYWEKQVLFACRQNQPTGYGFYFPAIDDHEDEDTINSKMRKISRLASIVEEERNLCDEGVDQQSTPCDSDSSKKDEVAAADHDIKIASLINTAELLKKEKSSNWLCEFKEWMDENSEKTEGDSLYVDFTNGNGRYMRQKKRHKAHRETSNNISDLVNTSEGGSSSNILESDSSFTDNACTVVNGVIKESTNEVNVDQAHLRMHLNSFQRPPPLELVGTSHSDPFPELGDGSRNMLSNGTPSNTMSKLIETSPPYTYPSPQSPPQYKEDILHRRLFLEEEFLQISGDLHSISIGSSCSDDSSDDLCSCNSEDDCVAMQTKMELALDGQMASFPFVDRDVEEKNSLEYFSGEKSLSDHSSENEPSCANDKEFDIEEFHDSNQRNGHLSHDLDHSVKQNGKQKFKRRVFPIFKNHNGAKLKFMKATEDQVDEHVLLEGNGHLAHSLSKSIPLKEQGSESHNSSVLRRNNSSISTNTISRNTDTHKIIEDFFNVDVANNGESETCEEVACCVHLFQDASSLVQREVALLRSSYDKLYVLLLDMFQDGQETVPRVLGSYRLESLEKVSIGLGLQALRVHMVDNTTHLFLTRTSKEAQDVLWLLSVLNFPKSTHGISLQSWENIQVKLLEKCICGSAKLGIFLYSMLMFSKNDAEEDSMVIRSIIVIEGSILVCIEDLDQFGGLPDDSNPPYFSLDAFCSIDSIQEVVVDQRNDKCLTMFMNNRMQEGKFHSSIQNSHNKQSDEIDSVHTWKLKWFSEETLLKFISVLKALYSAAAASSLPVKCIS